jgi:hypothetical protein
MEILQRPQPWKPLRERSKTISSRWARSPWEWAGSEYLALNSTWWEAEGHQALISWATHWWSRMPRKTNTSKSLMKTCLYPANAPYRETKCFLSLVLRGWK